MREFAELLERLAFTGGRNAKLALLAEYFARRPDPERGLALAALTGELSLGHVRPALLRAMVAERVDAELFALSYDFVGDLAETIALIWPEPGTEGARAQGGLPGDAAGAGRSVGLPEVVARLSQAPKAEVPGILAGWLDRMGPRERLAMLKLATGGMRVGVSARLARMALAQMGGQVGGESAGQPFGEPVGPGIEEIEELWHGLSPPYLDLFGWIEGGPRPAQAALAPFRPVMLSTPIAAEALAPLDPGAHVAEWKWDGIRVQAVSEGGVRRLYTRTGDDISGAFPDLVEALVFEGSLDGELLIRRDGVIAPFADLQKRLGRKAPGRAMLASHPAMLRAYDILTWQGEDLRARPFEARRACLEQAVAGLPAAAAARIDVSPLLPFAHWDQLAALRAAPPEAVIEGVMIKRRDSAYVAGRPRGPWFKWKRDPRVVDAVLVYAQRGHGKRSGFYSDFTFALWHDAPEDAGAGGGPGRRLVPVGKAYSGFTDEELRRLDRFVRANTVERFGPVRSLRPALVVEVAFEGVNASARHKSGLAMRFPRIARIRWDKPVEEADGVETLRAMLPEG